jgi:hypothetical protein
MSGFMPGIHGFFPTQFEAAGRIGDEGVIRQSKVAADH